MPRFIKAALKFLFVILTIVLGPLVVWEAWLQFELRVINKDPYEIIMYRDVHHKINAYWNAGYENKKIFWGPPYYVFLNRGEDDLSRLEIIHEKSILPQTHNGLSENFLRPKGRPEDSYYKVNVNSLGFRNVERPIKKGPKTFRIFVLGSYPAFGSGVNDNETYASYLEHRLNAKNEGLNIEVWNGGQQGTTAISGYARLVREIIDYQPDLLIWDFGWVDLYFGQDFVPPNEQASYRYPFVQEMARVMWRRMPHFLFSRHLYHFINTGFRAELLEDWRRLNQKMIAFADTHKLPVVLLKQRVVIIPNEEYTELASRSTNVSFINFQEVFRSGDLELPQDAKEEFWSRPNWLSEGGYSRDDKIPEERLFRVDSIMYGKYAHQIIADRLVEHIQPLIEANVKK